MEYDNNWEIRTIESDKKLDTDELLPLLSANKIAALKIPNFLSTQDLDIVVKNINKQDVSWYTNAEHKQGRIGISATEYYSKQNGKDLYFSLVPECSRVRESLFSGALDPIQKIIEVFSKDRGVSIAHEPSVGGTSYFSGLIRAMGAKSTLHFDYAPHQLPGWEVAESEEQFGLVLYLQMPSSGGELIVYNHPWKLEDDVYNEDILEKGPKGFNPEFLQSEKPTRISPIAGDLIIFRTRNFHQIEEIAQGQKRLTFNTFLSLKKEALYLWS